MNRPKLAAIMIGALALADAGCGNSIDIHNARSRGAGTGAPGQPSASSDADSGIAAACDKATTIGPILDRLCVSCHSDTTKSAGFSVENRAAWSDDSHWLSALVALRDRRMPPAGTAAPSAADLAAVDACLKPSGANLAVALPIESTLPRRLTPREYANTIKDIFDVNADDLVATFPVESSASGFRNGVDALRVTGTHIGWYATAAAEIARRVVAGGFLQRQALVCTDAPCAAKAIRSVGLSLFRRPLVDGESAAFVALAAGAMERGASYTEAFQLTLEGLLLAPQFIYRFEAGATGGTAAARPLDDYALASRLAFLVWHSAPDAELLSAAAAGSLHVGDGVEKEAKRMLASPKAKRALREFVGEWLQFNLLDTVNKNPSEFPEFSRQLVDDMRESALRLFEDIGFDSPKPFISYLDANFMFANDRLGGLVDPGNKIGMFRGLSSTLAKITLPVSSDRLGYFSQPTFLTLSSALGSTDPVRRGLFISQQALCLDVAPPPANVPALPSPVPNQTKRERYEHHRSSPSCASCHRYMDPVGYPLELFDTLGRARTLDEGGQPVDPSGTLAFDATVVKVAGPVALAKALAATPKAHNCATRKLLTYGLGFRVEDQDGLAAVAAEALESGGRYADIIQAIAASPAFRFTSAKPE